MAIARSKWLCLVLLAGLVLAGCSDPEPTSIPNYGPSLPDNVTFVSARRLKTQGLRWLANSPGGIVRQTTPPDGLLQQAEVTILVHGYNAPAGKITGYFEGLVSHLRSDEKYDHPIIVFDWPSEARHWEELTIAQREAYVEILLGTVGERTGRIPGLPPGLRWELAEYGFDRYHATRNGAEGLIELVGLLEKANGSIRINIVAHSMGCYVVSEVLKRKGKALSRLRRVLLLAPDIDKAALQDDAFNRISSLESLHVYFSNNDEVLKYYSTSANFGFARLGWFGPGDVKRLPKYMRVHDVSSALGTDGVHGKYVTRDGAAAIGIMHALRDP